MQAINNAESLRQFRGELSKLSSDLEQSLRETENSVNHLSQSWRDSKFKEFEGKFNVDKEQIRPLNQKIIEFESDTLKRKEDKIRIYLGN